MSRSYKLSILTLAVAALVSADAMAQRGGRGGGGGGPFGRGGGGGYTELLQREEVREEIMLVDDQLEQLEELNNDFRNAMRSEFEKMREEGSRDWTKIREFATQKQAEMKEEVDSILLPHQVSRLKQLSVQSRISRSGAQGALESDEVKDALGLTDEQLEEIRTVAEETQAELQEKIAELQKEARKKILAVLTPEQQKTWEELTGDEFKFQDRRRGGPQGRGGDRGGRARGGDRGGNDQGQDRNRRGFGRRPE